MFASLVLCWLLAPAPAAETSAQELFRSGQAKYETHDYRGAIADFTAAHELAQLIADPTEREEAVSRLAFNLARAHVLAFDVDDDSEHIELARRLLSDYRGHEREMGRNPDADTDVERLELALIERERVVDEAAAVAASDSRARGADPERNRQIQRRAGISLLAVAPAFAGLAVAGGLMGTNAASEFETATSGDARTGAQQQGRVGDVLFGVGVGLAAATAIAGVTLVIVSKPGTRHELSLVPQPRGISLGLRF